MFVIKKGKQQVIELEVDAYNADEAKSIVIDMAKAKYEAHAFNVKARLSR